MAAEKSPDWLPDGWVMDVKVRKTGQKDKYYIHLKTGRKFRSKDGVLRYIETGESHNCMPLQIERQANTCSSDKDVPNTCSSDKDMPNTCSRDKDMPLEMPMEDSPDWLPAGWVVEIKTRRGGSKVGQKYKCYIAPITGCRLYSKRDVYRYLRYYASNLEKDGTEMQSACDAVVKDAKEECTSGWIKEMRAREKGNKTRDLLPTAAKKQKLANNKTRRCLFLGQSSGLNETTDQQLVESCVKEECLSESVLDQSRENAELSGLPKPEAEGLENKQGKEVHAENGFISTPATGGSVEKHPIEKGVEKRRGRNGQKGVKKRRGRKSQKGVEKRRGRKSHLGSGNHKAAKEVLPRRASKRLAGLQAELPSDLDTSKRACSVAARNSAELEANPAVNPASEAHKAEPESGGSACLASKSVQLPSSKEPSKESERPVGDVFLEDITGKLETGKQAEEKPESPLVLPFGDSWPDPCLEFAFKTLTGEIPVEDTLAIEGYFQQQFSARQNQSNRGFVLPDLGLESFCKTDFVFQFGVPEKPVSKQQSLVFSSFGNGDLARSGANILQQPSGEGNKECRKW
ncbi:PREDICTED: uncharacterized protein LOC104596134 isoform X2 [Nelumbo nucifera]|uniref:Uncharacterized protein LOC104596134 isoform X2 n=1 Tax=Nelumbo nucifera TaxID=4432 RepID=A0A1U7ZPZ9_NELNU|nr:PREDICTED: uncharacterized protein LOC104596134 isoform X2 [Nelumbo nucifera]